MSEEVVHSPKGKGERAKLRAGGLSKLQAKRATRGSRGARRRRRRHGSPR